MLETLKKYSAKRGKGSYTLFKLDCVLCGIWTLVSKSFIQKMVLNSDVDYKVQIF
jgi:hypothetical protein